MTLTDQIIFEIESRRSLPNDTSASVRIAVSCVRNIWFNLLGLETGILFCFEG